MCANRILFAGIVLGSVAISAIVQNASGQGWQPARSQTSQQSVASDNPVTQVNWEDRVLKRPQPQLQWQPARQPAQRSAEAYGQADGAYTTRTVSQPSATYQTARRSVFDRDNVFDTASAPKEPTTPTPEPEVIPRGEEVAAPGITQFEPMATEGSFAGSTCGTYEPCDESGVCDRRGQPASDAGCDFGYEIFDGSCRGFRNLTLAAGVQGFKGPLDRGVNGNFGFNEGLNLGGPVGDPWNCGYQIGANFLQSNLSSGQQVTVGDRNFTIPDRNQNFVTAALFRRAVCNGLQWGIAYDYLHDNYFQQYDLQQIRSETGLVLNETYEIGYYGAYGVSSAQLHNRNIDGRLDPTDQFVLYARRNFENGADIRFWGGATGNGDGLIGADLFVPLARNLALTNRINYLIPNGSITGQRDNTTSERESWGMMVQLVWYPGQMALCQHKNQYRPMFNVADNSLFMVDRLISR